jgi:hypothetical protein
MMSDPAGPVRQPGSLFSRWLTGGLVSPAVVAGPGACLVLAAPGRPGQPVSDRVDGIGDQLGEQATDLV